MNYKIFSRAILLPVLTIGCYACNDGSSTVSQGITKKELTLDSPKIDSRDSTEIKLPTRPVSKPLSKIVFGDLTVSLYGFLAFDEEGKLDKVQPDSTNIQAELGETIEGQVIEVKSSEIINIEIEQRYETSVTIMGEGPHCDLLDWKHYYSDWKPLRITVSGQFIGLEYSEADREKFTPVSMDELRRQVSSLCGVEWAKPLKDITSPTQMPAGVGISRYYLRITGKRKSDLTPVTKIIVIENPMGC